MLPKTGFLRLKDIIGDQRHSDRLPILPISKSAWWEGIRRGRYPAPVKLGPHTTAWRVEHISALIEQGTQALQVIGVLRYTDLIHHLKTRGTTFYTECHKRDVGT